jgi:tetratricopeptide (TPR) repeat protein
MRKIIALSVFAFLSTARGIHAQSPTVIDSLIIKGKEQIQNSLDTWNLQQMLAARAFFERMAGDTTYSWLIHYYLGYADSRLFNYYFSEDDKEKAKEYINDGLQHLETSIALKEDFAEIYALLGSLLGKKIGLNPLLGITLGSKSGHLLEKACTRAPTNPRVLLIAGQSSYYTPKMFGGGKEKAMKQFQNAIRCFETFKPESPVYPDWGHEEAYAFLGMAQMEQDRLTEAKRSFEKALSINPNYGWVRYQLLKDLNNKMVSDSLKIFKPAEQNH